MPSENPLLSDLEAEKHQFLLERGNLIRKPSQVPFTPTIWRSEGYSARVIRHVCETCSRETPVLEGIFHVETSPSGATRLTRLGPRAQVPLNQSWPITETLTETPVCAYCISDLGFSRLN